MISDYYYCFTEKAFVFLVLGFCQNVCARVHIHFSMAFAFVRNISHTLKDWVPYSKKNSPLLPATTLKLKLARLVYLWLSLSLSLWTKPFFNLSEIDAPKGLSPLFPWHRKRPSNLLFFYYIFCFHTLGEWNIYIIVEKEPLGPTLFTHWPFFFNFFTYLWFTRFYALYFMVLSFSLYFFIPKDVISFCSIPCEKA